MSVDSNTAWRAEDGIVDVDLYNKQRLRILWVLREPNGGDFPFMDFLRDVTVYPKWEKSYGLVAKVSRIILDELFDNEAEWNYSDPKVIRRIALINVKKTEGAGTVNWKEMTKFFNENKDMLNQQIAEINPGLIICGGTEYYVRKLGVQGCPTIYLCHPGVRPVTISHKGYIEQAITQYRKCFGSNC